MNHSRGAVSAETVASTNEPLIVAMDHHPMHHKLIHQHRLHNANQHHSSAPTTTTLNYHQNTNGNNGHDELHSSSSSIVDYFTKSIHQQLNPSTSSLPSLLARSLVALGGDPDDQQQEQQASKTTAATLANSITATDIDQQFNNNNHNNNNYEQSFSDWWTDYWSRQPFPSGYTQSSITLLACLITTIIFLIVVGNLLVVVAIFTEKSLKPTQNWFIASLAVSDMLLGLVVMPFSLARELMGFWIFGPLWCDIHEAIDVLLTTASINTLCLISLDRYWSITQAVNYLKKRTPRRGAFMIAFVWIFSAAVSLPPLFGWKKQSPTIIANITKATTMSHPSNPNNTKRNQKSHHQQQLAPAAAANSAKSRSLSTQTATTSKPPRTTTISDPLELDRAKRRSQEDPAAGLKPSDRRRRFEQMATPHMVIGRRNDPLQPGSRLMRALEPEPSNGGDESTLLSLFDQENRDFAGQQEQYANNPNTIDLPAANSYAGDPQQQPNSAPQTTNQVTEYPSCQLSDDIGYVLYSALGSFYIPCAVMVFTYIKIFLAARSRARRAISKQSRGAAAIAASKQRQAARRTPNPAQAPVLETSGNSNPITSCNSVAVSTTGQSKLNGHQELNGQQAAKQAPIMKGKIVIFERKKSLAGIPLQQQLQQQKGANLVDQQKQIDSCQAQSTRNHQMNRATYTCSDLINTSGVPREQQPKGDQSNHEAVGSAPELLEMAPAASDTTLSDGCTLTTSGAKQASPSALNGESPSQESSMITVMNASMVEVPVTRFNFKQPQQQQQGENDLLPAAATTIAPGNGQSQGDERDGADDGGRKAAALLMALCEAGNLADDKEQSLMTRGVWSPDSGEMSGEIQGGEKQRGHCLAQLQDLNTRNSNNIKQNNSNNSHESDTVIKRARNVSDELGAEAEVVTDQHHQLDQVSAQVVNTTNETCFMTIEEDSDMFDAQTGRTIMMIAGNVSQKQAKNLSKTQGGIMMTMLPPGDQKLPAITAASQQQQSPRSVVCNNVVCMRSAHQVALPTRSGSSYCGSSMTINYDDIDDCVDDELLTDDCNGYSISCGLDQYCSSIVSCPQCQECKQHQLGEQGHFQEDQLQPQLASDGTNTNNDTNRHLSISDSPGQRKIGAGARTNQVPAQRQQKQATVVAPSQHHHHHHHLLQQDRRLSEAHSLTGEDNLSLNEYRSNEDSSSIMGHDVLDATENHNSDKRRPASSGGSSRTPIVGGRKKSSIGFRLARLGSTAPLSIQGGGLLALASSQQQQQQNHQAGGGTRNLKALRQNFFMKLNQLTAKSAAKQQEYKSKKMNETSPTGKSSAQSSGTSYEPSVDYATTSNVQSADYPPEITAGTMDDSEQQTSGEPQSSLTSKGAEMRGQHQRGSCSSGTNSSGVGGNHKTLNKESDSRHYDAIKGTILQPGACDGGVSSTASDIKFKKSACANNNQTSDKNDDRAMLLRDPAQQQSGQDGGNKQRLIGGDSDSTFQPTSGQNEKSRISNGKDTNYQQKQQQQQQTQPRTKGPTSHQATGHMNHNSALAQTGTGISSGGTTSRAYLASDNERHKRKLAKARERRATLILGLIMAAFICSWMPFFTFYVLRALCTVCRDFISPRFEAFIFWMGYCNSAINPIIYTIFNRDFRKAFRKILFKCL